MAQPDKPVRPALLTRTMVADIIQVRPPQIKAWSKSRNSMLLKLPSAGRHPLHEKTVVAEIERTHRRTEGIFPLIRLPEKFLTLKEIRAHYGVCAATVKKWNAAGCPCFIFTERTIRYLTEEMDIWYMRHFGRHVHDNLRRRSHKKITRATGDNDQSP